MAKTILYQITLLEPAIFSALDGEPNSAVSYDFIPGSTIRGLLIGTYQNIDADDEQAQRLFFSGSTRFLNAYRWSVDAEQRCLPVPATWQTAKYGDGKTIYDDAMPRPKNDEPKGKSTSPKGFAALAGDDVFLPPVDRILNVHIQRRRPGEEKGELYRYDALASGQTFAGAVLCDVDADAERLLEHFADLNAITIGGARSAGYGQAALHDIQLPDHWDEAPFGSLNTRPLIVTFLSEAVLRNDNGEYATTHDAILAAFNRKGITATITRAALDDILIGGFNRTTGLPLPQTPAIKRGSVLIMDYVQATDDALHNLMWQGIGERREEGFGRIAFNWQQHHELHKQEASDARILVNLVSPTLLQEHADALMGRIDARLKRKQNEGIIITDVFRKNSYRVSGNITKAQLARLRLIIAQEQRRPTKGVAVVTDFLDDIQGKAAGKQYAEAQIGRATLDEWLRDFTQNRDFGNETLLQFIDAVLERAQKDRQGEK